MKGVAPVWLANSQNRTSDHAVTTVAESISVPFTDFFLGSPAPFHRTYDKTRHTLKCLVTRCH